MARTYPDGRVVIELANDRPGSLGDHPEQLTKMHALRTSMPTEILG